LSAHPLETGTVSSRFAFNSAKELAMIFALILFGCADDGSQCEKLAAAPRHYESQLLCEADAVLALHGDLALRADYPTVEARCMPEGLSGTHSFASAEYAADRIDPARRFLRSAQPRPR
jgi:hypothetical protein